MDDFLS